MTEAVYKYVRGYVLCFGSKCTDRIDRTDCAMDGIKYILHFALFNVVLSLNIQNHVIYCTVKLFFQFYGIVNLAVNLFAVNQDLNSTCKILRLHIQVLGTYI